MRELHCKGYVKPDYPIYLSKDSRFSELSKLIPTTQKRFIIIDNKIPTLFPAAVRQLTKGETHIFPIKSEESNKSLKSLEQLLKAIFSLKPSRDDILIVMGGGLVTNLGGLAASLTMRGIRFYYVPTTLTGQIDASMGSKQAVNYRGAKNWLGIFNDPELCYINPHFLSTISRYEFNSQAIEGLKLCLATDKALFFEVSEDLEDLYHATIEDRFTFLEKMIMAKLAVLREDLTEENYGMCMLYGHTIGHAVEMLDHENISHGEGVGLGMLTAARLSYMLGIADRSLVEVHRELLSKLGLPTKIPSYLTSASIIGKLSHNKKNYEGKSHFVLLKGIGQMSARNGSYHTVISHDLVSAALEQGY